MDLTTLLIPANIAHVTELSSRKRAFETLATMLTQHQTDLSIEQVFEALTNREKLGCTALGNGIAIPHACLPIQEPLAALLITDEAVKMDTPDKKPVSAFLSILVPEQESEKYAAIITRLATLLTQKTLIESLQAAPDIATALQLLQTAFSAESPTMLAA